MEGLVHISINEPFGHEGSAHKGWGISSMKRMSKHLFLTVQHFAIDNVKSWSPCARLIIHCSRGVGGKRSYLRHLDSHPLQAQQGVTPGNTKKYIYVLFFFTSVSIENNKSISFDILENTQKVFL